MKKKAHIIISAVTAGILFPVILYLAVGFYYRNGFGFGTFVNGVYCTGKTVEEVNKELAGLYEQKAFSIQDSAGRVYEIPLSAVQFGVDYSSQLEFLENEQNDFLWSNSKIDETINPQINFDEDMLREALDSCGIMQANEKEHVVEIRYEDGYWLYDGMQDVLDMEHVYQLVSDSLRRENFSVDVSSCYTDLPYTREMQNTIALWEKVDSFQTCGIVYDMGDETIPLSKEIVSGWIALNEDSSFVLDEEGNLVFREECAEEFIDMLCRTYDTLGSSRTFHATRGEDVVIEGGTYGNKIDSKAEILWLKEAFANGVQEVRIPVYEKEAYVRGRNDIGDTFVEVDMTSQKLYYYEAGELKLETDIVTGNTGRRWGTPSGVNYVYNMQTNRVLRGPGYASHVNYWVPVKGSIGIHDASWRKEFGGEIYKTNGSHGCINVPGDKMEELYNMLEIGVPVVMFY